MTRADELVVVGPRPLRGRLRLPGDKGISHRALFAASLANGASAITDLAPGDDVARTQAALDALGVRVMSAPDGVSVEGAGVEALHEPAAAIDCGNSGTTMRMLVGLLAGRPFRTVLTGDASLSERPMQRVVTPLRTLGATIDGRDGGNRAPLEVSGAQLTGATVELEVASGQVKTALVLAGLQASGTTEIVEPAPSRDHTERLFGALAAPVERVDDRTTRVRAGAPEAFTCTVPGDPSSAAFFVVAATITQGSELVLEDVLLNPGRIAFIDVLRSMGASIEVHVREDRLGEPVGDLAIRSAPLRGTTFTTTEAIIDEIPVLAVAASFADGLTEIRNVAELRVKESNRAATIEHELTMLGIGVEAHGDVLVVRGGRPRAATLESHGDHRIAMAAAVAASAVEGESRVRGWSSVAVSYPHFAEDLDQLAGMS
ncbi:MAG: 3-phosphoshikimate 1-carboxyvinyltransferase [Acidimicrobiia bacterium]